MGEDDKYNRELCNERHDRLDDLLDRTTEQIDHLEKCTIILTELVERFDKTLTAQGERIETMEKEPFRNLKRAVGYLVGAIAGVLAGMLMNSVGNLDFLA